MYGIILFENTSGAMKCEKMLLKHGYQIKMIPTPREFSSDCGVSIRFDYKQLESIQKLISEAHIPINSIHFFDIK